MKTYEEMAHNALGRIHQYESEQKKRRNTVMKITAPAVTVCLAVIIGAVLLSGKLTDDPNITQPDVAVPSGEPDWIDETDSGTETDGSSYDSVEKVPQSSEVEITERDPEESGIPIPNPNGLIERTEIPDVFPEHPILRPGDEGYIEPSAEPIREIPADDDVIIINELTPDKTPDFAARTVFDLNPEDCIELDKTGLAEHFGFDIFPAVPDDLRSWNDDSDSYDIYRIKNGEEEAYYDKIILNYSNETYQRNLNIELQSGAIPFLDFVVGTEGYETSVIGGQDVLIGRNEDTGYYFASLMHRNVGFAITANGLTAEEIVSVIRSIIK